MSPLMIVKFPADVLTQPTRAVEKFDSSLRTLAENLVQVMIQAPGIGVAANQVGIDLSVAVIGIPSHDRPLVLVNPRILKASTPIQVDEEGCLSLPGYWGRPMRSERVRLEFHDVEGKSRRLDASGYLAQVIQHETDHLSGVVYEQRLPDGESLNVIESQSASGDSG